jgi:competence ComEA-like helix-hairpin-helix protein
MMKHSRSLIALLAVLGTVGPAFAGGKELTRSVTVESKININTADVTALMTLSGIGRAVAERIVEYRQAHGPFQKPEDLRRVEGVGRGLWERNRERIVIE